MLMVIAPPAHFAGIKPLLMLLISLYHNASKQAATVCRTRATLSKKGTHRIAAIGLCMRRSCSLCVLVCL